MNQQIPLKIGFIGGSIHSAIGYTHFCASRLDNKWELVSGCFSTDLEHNTETGATYGVDPSRVYANWKEFLQAEADQVDAIAALTPTPEHYKIVRACLESGVPVICEKALGVSSEEAISLAQLKNSTAGFLAVTFNYSFYPMVKELKRKVELNELGEILHFQVTMPQQGYLKNTGKPITVQDWRLSEKIIPNLHMDLAVHMHQLVDYVTGLSALSVISHQGSFGNFDVIDDASALCKYQNGVHGYYWFSKSAIGHRNGLSISIYGSKASATWVQAEPELLRISYANGDVQIIDRSAKLHVGNEPRFNRFKAGHPAGFIEAFANLYDQLADDVRQYKNTGIWDSEKHLGAETAANGLAFIEAMVESSLTGSWKELSN
jgi:predicted dehydrogenase